MDSKKSKAVAVIAAVAMIIAAVGIYAVMSAGGGAPEGSRVGTQLSASELPDAESRLWVYGNANGTIV
jgi:hypothetical protein